MNPEALRKPQILSHDQELWKAEIIQEIQGLHLELSDRLFKRIENMEKLIIALAKGQITRWKEQSNGENTQLDTIGQNTDSPNSGKIPCKSPTPANQMKIDTDDWEVPASASSGSIIITCERQRSKIK